MFDLDKMAEGFFTLFPGTENEIIVENNICNEGKLVLLKQALRADTADVTAGGNYYIGLGSFAYDATVGLAALAGELVVANGYARKAVSRDATGWPTTQQIQNAWAMTTLQVVFTASGGNIGPFNRLFLCTVGSGTSGKLISVSSALATPVTLTPSQALPLNYTLYLN